MNYRDYQPEDFLTDELFIRWASAPDAETEAFWQQWLARNPDKQATVRKAKLLLNQLGTDSASLGDEEVESLQRRIQVSTGQTPALPLHKSRHIFVRQMAATFAGILLLVSAVYFLPGLTSDTLTVSTDFGETETVRLPDGSTVILNANSTITYPRAFDQGREVQVMGEAYFEVVHTENHARFVVHTATLDVEVLGTQFSVNTRQEESRVVLDEGSVKVSRRQNDLPQEPVYLAPGELAELLPGRSGLQKKMVDPYQYIAWKDNKLIFRDTPLGEIATLLKHNFNYTVVFEDESLRRETFRGTFPADDPEILLKTLSKSLDIRTEKRTLLIKRKP